MDTLFAIGMMVGLMKSHAEPPKADPALEQRQVAQHQVKQPQVAAEKPRQQAKKKRLAAQLLSTARSLH